MTAPLTRREALAAGLCAAGAGLLGNSAGDREGMCLDTLAAAHAEAGDFAAAVKTQEKALEDRGFLRKYGDDAQKRLQLYQDKKPYRTKPLK